MFDGSLLLAMLITFFSGLFALCGFALVALKVWRRDLNALLSDDSLPA